VGLISEHQLQLGSDEGAFAVRDQADRLEADDWDGNTLVQVTSELGAETNVLVLTGDQFGPFAITTQHHDSPPSRPSEDWEDVVEFSVRSYGSLIVGELVNYDPSTVVAGLAGEYRVRVSARGRGVGRADDDSDGATGEGPVEWYLIEAWEALAAPAEVIRLRSPHALIWVDGGPRLVEVPEAEAGLAAAARIGRDVDGAPGRRTLSGRVGTAHVERTMLGTRRKLFRSFAYVTNWSQWAIGGSSWSAAGNWSEEPYPLHHPDFGFADDSSDQLSGREAGIRTQFTEVDPPHRVVRQWDWVARVNPGDFITLWEPVLPAPTYATFELTQRKNEEGKTVTTVSLTHTDLPEEWVDDMAAWWQFQFAIADLNDFGTRR
jgi:hypothetical protein